MFSFYDVTNNNSKLFIFSLFKLTLNSYLLFIPNYFYKDLKHEKREVDVKLSKQELIQEILFPMNSTMNLPNFSEIMFK